MIEDRKYFPITITIDNECYVDDLICPEIAIAGSSMSKASEAQMHDQCKPCSVPVAKLKFLAFGGCDNLKFKIGEGAVRNSTSCRSSEEGVCSCSCKITDFPEHDRRRSFPIPYASLKVSSENKEPTWILIVKDKSKLRWVSVLTLDEASRINKSKGHSGSFNQGNRFAIL